jgi:hypothetical protein
VTLTWDFKTWARGDKVRDPIQGEFFSTDAIKNPAEALVREDTQNSLDAGTGKPVRVRFYISGTEGAVPAERMKFYMNGSWEHFNAEGNGLRDVPKPTDNCPFLVCEDFSTRGLEGDPGQWQELPGVKNHFYYFFRTEGKSAKTEQERGRWGIGKYVFPRSSRINAFFAVTARADKRRLLMGQAVLKSHWIGKKYYKPDGSLGVDQAGLIMPFEDAKLIDDFCADFKLKRGNEPGLSVVVPWYDKEIGFNDLVAACARDYFYALLSGDLVVDIESPTDTLTLSATSLEATLAATAPDLAKELAPMFELAKWAITLEQEKFNVINVPPPAYSYKWEDVEIPEELIAALRPRVQAGERIAFRVHLNVYPKGRPSTPSFFDIFMVRDDDDEQGRPIFIRDGIIISDVRPKHRNRGMRAIVIVDDGPLATLLGDSENPAHTQWQRDSSHFKGKYTYGPSYIEFVTGSVAAIVRAIVETEQEIDPTLLIDFFSLPAGGGGDKQKGPGDKDEDKEPPPPPPPPPPPKLQRFRINRIKGGFSVTPGDPAAVLPPRIEIRTAYDVRRGNAISRYRPEDFKLDKAPIKIEKKGVDIVETENNRMLFAIQDKGFSLTVSGFDENRDLVVRGVVKGDTGD